MKIIRLGPDYCIEYQNDIAKFIHSSMNRGCECEWFSMDAAALKATELKKYIAAKKAYAFLAVAEKPEGFAWAYPYGGERSLYLSIIYVNESCRGKSVGTGLISALEKIAKEEGYEKIWLHTDADNNSSRNFYAHVGYHEKRIQLVKHI